MYTIIISHFISDYIRLATGGKNGCFNSEAIQVKCNARSGSGSGRPMERESPDVIRDRQERNRIRYAGADRYRRTAKSGSGHRGLFPVLPDKAADAPADD